MEPNNSLPNQKISQDTSKPITPVNPEPENKNSSYVRKIVKSILIVLFCAVFTSIIGYLFYSLTLDKYPYTGEGDMLGFAMLFIIFLCFMLGIVIGFLSLIGKVGYVLIIILLTILFSYLAYGHYELKTKELKTISQINLMISNLKSKCDNLGGYDMSGNYMRSDSECIDEGRENFDDSINNCFTSTIKYVLLERRSEAPGKIIARYNDGFHYEYKFVCSHKDAF